MEESKHKCEQCGKSVKEGWQYCTPCDNDHKCAVCDNRTCYYKCVPCMEKDMALRIEKECRRCKRKWKPANPDYQYCESCFSLETKGIRCNVCNDLFVPIKDRKICGKCWYRD